MNYGDEDEDKKAFLEKIFDRPNHDGPRLIYADWLQEHGGAARAQFMRMQCALAKMPGTDERYVELWRQQKKWLPKVLEEDGWRKPDAHGHYSIMRDILDSKTPQEIVRLDRYERGMPLVQLYPSGGVSGCTFNTSLGALQNLRSENKIPVLQQARFNKVLVADKSDVNALLQSPNIARVHGIQVSFPPRAYPDSRYLHTASEEQRAAEVGQLLEKCKHIHELDIVSEVSDGLPDLSNYQPATRFLERLVQLPGFKNIRHLHIRCVNRGVSRIFSADLMSPDARSLNRALSYIDASQLQSLTLQNCGYSDLDITHLFRSELKPQNIKTLNLSENLLSNQVIFHLGLRDGIRHLNLSGNNISAPLEEWLQAPQLSDLVSLDLTNNYLGTQSVLKNLIGDPNLLPSLSELEISNRGDMVTRPRDAKKIAEILAQRNPNRGMML